MGRRSSSTRLSSSWRGAARTPGRAQCGSSGSCRPRLTDLAHELRDREKRPRCGFLPHAPYSIRARIAASCIPKRTRSMSVGAPPTSVRHRAGDVGPHRAPGPRDRARRYQEVVKKPAALGISRSGGAPHVFQHTLRFLRSGGTPPPFARDGFFTTSQALRPATMVSVTVQKTPPSASSACRLACQRRSSACVTTPRSMALRSTSSRTVSSRTCARSAAYTG